MQNFLSILPNIISDVETTELFISSVIKTRDGKEP